MTWILPRAKWPLGIHRSVTPLTVLLLTLAGLTGCGAASSADDSEELHQEHHVPAHKPANFKEAVDELERRAQALSDHADHSHGDEPRKLTELVDIAGWIPELAADSELSEADWTAAVTAGRAAGEILTPLSGTANPDLQNLAADMAPQIRQLRVLVPRAGKPEARIAHGHHHHEHGHDDHHEDHGHDEHGHDHGHADDDDHHATGSTGQGSQHPDDGSNDPGHDEHDATDGNPAQ